MSVGGSVATVATPGRPPVFGPALIRRSQSCTIKALAASSEELRQYSCPALHNSLGSAKVAQCYAYTYITYTGIHRKIDTFLAFNVSAQGCFLVCECVASTTSNRDNITPVSTHSTLPSCKQRRNLHLANPVAHLLLCV